MWTYQLTADVVVSDGSNTNSYGEPCETGYGYFVESGYYDPDWNAFDVYPESEQARVYGPFVSLAAAREHAIREHLGNVEQDDETRIYTTSERDNFNGRRVINVVAHFEQQIS